MQDNDDVIYIPSAERGALIGTLPISVRLGNVLENSGIKLIGDLHGLAYCGFLRMRNCGKKTIDELKDVVRSLQSGNIEAFPRIPVARDPNLLEVQPHLTDILLAELPISVRLSNVFEKHGFTNLGELNGVNTEKLLQTKNCGKKCIIELRAILRRAEIGEFTTAPERDVVGALRTIMRAVDAGLERLGRRDLKIFEERLFGNNGEPRTLEEVGGQFGMTRERVRQIVKFAFQKILRGGGPVLVRAIEVVACECEKHVLPLTLALFEKLLCSETIETKYNTGYYVRVLDYMSPSIPAWPLGSTSEGRNEPLTVSILDALERWMSESGSRPIAKEAFDSPVIKEIPAELSHEGETILFTNTTYSYPGRLVLKTSKEPLRATLSSLNTVDFIGEVGVIGSYRVHELGATRFSGQVEFIYGECECPILEDPDHDCVKNDRQKLHETDRTLALLDWVREQVETLAEQMETKNQQERKAQDLKDTSALNEMLNRWKDRFMSQVWTEMFAGQGPAGSAGGEKGAGGTGKGDSTKKDGDKQNDGQEGGSETTRKPRFPQVLVSGQDNDPLDSLSTLPFMCDPRHPAVYQRTKDVPAGIYWINTSRPLAEKIITEYTAESTRWREYLFQRYVEIISKEAVYELGKTTTSLTADDVIRQLDDVTTRVHDQASKDLNSFLFQETLSPTTP